MGISDDIKPRKVYSYSKKPKVESDHKATFELKKNQEKENKNNSEPEPIIAPTAAEPYQYKDFLEDDFFSNKEVATKKSKTKKHKIGKFVRITLWILTIVVVLFVFYKNLDKIETLLLGPEKEATTTSNSNEIYTSESTTPDTTASSQNTASSTSTAANSSTTAETATTVKSDIKIEVLNGNGISGSADKVKATLVESGFTVSKVANAKKFTYTSTYIYYKTGAEASMELVKAALSDRTCVTQKSDPITTGYDIVVVLGKK